MPSFEHRLFAFEQLGRELQEFLTSDLKGEERSKLYAQAEQENAWFVELSVQKALQEICSWLEPDSLRPFAEKYRVEKESSKTIGLILAGNIPAVGFHDLMCVLLSGHRAWVKCSSSDSVLIHFLLDALCAIDAEFKKQIEYKDGQLKGADAYISTGSNNSARYFEHYFGKFPHIIRKNRHGVAVISEETTDEELKSLSHDIFQYFGLGCRNVSKIYVPKGFDLNRIYKAAMEYEHYANSVKYYNNYHYHRTIYLLNKELFYDNGFLILKEDKNMSSPVGVLHYEFYTTEPEIPMEEVQCLLSNKSLAFGSAQQPRIDDFADQVDTMDFLRRIHTAEEL